MTSVSKKPVRSTAEAKRLADTVFRTHGEALPVNVEDIAKRYGLQVIYRPADADVSGMLVVKGGTGLILVNQTHAPQRQRFTVAHELGHYLMHRQPNQEAFFRDERSSQGISHQEIQANAFAASLLMPASEIRRFTEGRKLSPLDSDIIYGLAQTFDVSSEAMSIRLQDLKLLRLETYW